MKYKAHVISHSHWDREWYKPFQHYRIRLVKLVDTLIDLLETNPKFKYFTFDGQFVFIEDYLAIRPEMKDRLLKLCKNGRILLGPWYNQPDQFLVSGESLVRNLLEGKDRCNAYGNWMQAGYVPDCFGQISQLPQIFKGFGIDFAVLWRGITTDQVDSEFAWEGADGSELTVFKLQDDYGYANYFYKMADSLVDPKKELDEKEVIKQMKALIDLTIKTRPTTNQLLFMDGCDHVFPQFKTPAIIDIANKNIENIELVHSTFMDCYKELMAKKPQLAKQYGELRTSNRMWRCQGILANVLSSRENLKQLSLQCENLLEKYFEPLYTCLSTLGVEYPRGYSDVAWEYLLKNSPHDSICGCSVDQVHKDMVYRYDQCSLIASQLVKDGMDTLADKIKWSAKKDENSLLLTLFNPLAHSVNEVIDTYIQIPGEWPIKSIRVTNERGEEVPSSLLGYEEFGLLEPTPYDIPRGELTKKVHIAFDAFAIPQMGYKSYKVEILGKPNRQEASLLIAPNAAENDYLVVIVNSDGTLSIFDKQTETAYDDCLIFEDEGDIGDGYKFIKPLKDTVVTSLGSKTRVSVAENSSVRVVFEIVSELELPAKISPNKQTRSKETVTCPITSYVTLGCDSKRIDVKTVFENNACDHRLRVLFPSGIETDYASSETVYDVVERAIEVPLKADWTEALPTVCPQKTFMDMNNGKYGLTIANKALQEFEVKNDEARTIAVTLLRCTGGGVRGLDLHIEGQMLGTYTLEYSIIPHEGCWQYAKTFQEAHAFNIPVAIGCSYKPKKSGLPMEHSFMNVESDSFVITAFKQAQNKDGFILRGYNTSTKSDSVALSWEGAKSYTQVDLKEDKIKGISSKTKDLCFETKPKEIITFRIKN